MNKFLNLENFVYLIIFLLPTYLVRFSVLGLPINLLEVLILMLFIGWLVLGKRKKEKMKNSFKMYRKYIFLISLIFLGLILSALFGENYERELGIIKGWFLLPFGFAFLAKNILESDKWKNLYSSLFFSSFVVAVISLGYLLTENLTYDGRLRAIFNSPNYLGMYLSFGLIVGVIGVVFKKGDFFWFNGQVQNLKCKVQNYSLKFKAYVFFSIGIIGMALYFTYSYASWVAVFVSLGIVVLLKIKNKKLDNVSNFWMVNSKYLVLGGLIGIFLLYLQFDTVKFQDLVDFDDRSSLASRGMIWRSAGNILKDNWFLGIGPGNFQSKYLEYQKYYPPYLEWAVPHPHNLYLTFWLYTGIIGLAGFLGLIILFWKNIFRVSSLECITYIAAGLMAYILIHGLVDTTYFKNDLAVVFWVVVFTDSSYAKSVIPSVVPIFLYRDEVEGSSN